MICILCGGNLHQNLDLSNGPHVIGYTCKSCGETWTIDINKNFENWAVRHIRALEEQLAAILEAMRDAAE